MPYRTSDDRIDGIVMTFNEITAAKKADDALKESELRLREVLENSQNVSYKRNLKTNTYDYLSPVLTIVTGYTPEEMKNLPFEKYLELISPDDIAEIERVIAGSLTGPSGESYMVEYRFRHKDGEYRWLIDRFAVMRNEAGENLAIIGSMSDVTERKRVEAALVISETRYRRLSNQQRMVFFCSMRIQER